MEKINSEGSAVHGDCLVHQHAIEYICVDPVCRQTPFSCMFCIKDQHKSCRDEFIIEEERLSNDQRISEVFDLQLQENNLQAEKKQIAQTISNQVEAFKTKVRSLSESFDILIKGNIEEIIEDQNALKFFKKFYRINFNDQSKLYEAHSVFNVDKEEADSIIEHFKKDMNGFYKMFVKNIEDYPLEFSTGLKAPNFLCHKFISIKKKGNGLSFTRVPGSTDFNYFSAIYQVPLKGVTKLEVTIDGINSGDPYLDVGIVDSKKFKSFSTDPVVSFASDTFSYCGTSQSGMSGTYGSAKFQPGFVFIMEFNPVNMKLSFTTKDKVVNLYKENLKKNEPYHFFLTLYHPEAACTIRVTK